MCEIDLTEFVREFEVNLKTHSDFNDGVFTCLATNEINIICNKEIPIDPHEKYYIIANHKKRHWFGINVVYEFHFDNAMAYNICGEQKITADVGAISITDKTNYNFMARLLRMIFGDD